MHLLPSSFDGSLFLGTTLDCVCFYRFSVVLRFVRYEKPTLPDICPACGITLRAFGDKGKWIQIESEWILRCGNEVVEHITGFPIQSSKLLCAIGKEVIRFDIDKEKNAILLQFESGISIEIIDTPNGYETYKIDDGEQYIIV